MEIEDWLGRLGLVQYAPSFRANDINTALLASLTADDLKELGISSIGHRRRLLDAIAALRASPHEGDPRPGATAEPPPAGSTEERRQLSVLFCDLVGFTPLAARLDAEDLAATVKQYHGAVARSVRDQGGYVAQYLGDGVMAYFGWPLASEDDAERSVRAALDAVRNVAALATPAGKLAARAGIATGLVVGGDLIGEGAASGGVVVGETPNLAARLQAEAEPGTVAVCQTTRRLAGNLFNWTDLGTRHLKGVAQPMPVARAIEESGIESRFEARQPGRVSLPDRAGEPPGVDRETTPLSPLAGREEHLDLLRRRWRRVREGNGQVVLIGGEPGIGKSRLVVALRQDPSGPDTTSRRVEWSSVAHQQESPFHPVIAWLRRFCDICQEDDPARTERKILEALASALLTAEEAGVLSSLLGRQDDTPAALDPRRRRSTILGALLRWLEREAARAPLLVVLEDIHWADASTRELIDLIVHLAKRAPILVIVTHRMGYEPPWSGLSHVTELRLSRLDRADTARLVDVLIGQHKLPDDVRAAIVDRSEGVPLFAEELTRAILDTLAEQTGLAAAIEAIPSTLGALLTARLDRAGRTARFVAQAGAAIGREFEHDLVAAVTQLPAEALDDALHQLASAGLLMTRGVPPDATYSFKHALVRDAAYELQLRNQRRELHGRIAAALATLRPHLADLQPEVLAAHCTMAGDDTRALVLWEAAGERALGRYALAEAAAHLRRAASLVRQMPTSSDTVRRELQILSSLGQARFGILGSEAETTDVFARTISLAKEFGDAKALCRATYGMFTQHAIAGELRLNLELGAQLLRFAAGHNSVEARICAGRILGTTHLWLGNLETAETELNTAISLQQSIGRPQIDTAYAHHPGLTAPIPLAFVVWARGDSARAAKLASDAVEACRHFPDVNSLPFSLLFAALLNLMIGDSTKALDLASETLAVARTRGTMFWQLHGNWASAAALAMAGDTDAGRSLLVPALEQVLARGGRQSVPLGFLIAAEAALKAGDIAACVSALASAEHIITNTEQNLFLPELRRVQARLHASSAHPDRAIVRLQDALAICARQGAACWEPRLIADLAAVQNAIEGSASRRCN